MSERSFALLTCSGVSNTGRLTTQAASILVRRYPERFTCHLTAKQTTHDLICGLEYTDCLVVIDGCKDQCAAKKLSSSGLGPDIHIIATDQGIEKNGMADVQFWEIEQLVQAISRAVQDGEKNDFFNCVLSR